MQLTGNAATDIATLVIFDPDEIRDVLEYPQKNIEGLEKAIGEGRMAMHNPGADCGYDFAIFVDEAPPESLSQRFKYKGTGWLKISSGVMCYTGAEDLWIDDRPEQPDAFEPGMGKRFEIPAGLYRLHGYEMNWGEEEVEEILAADLSAEHRDVLKNTIPWLAYGCGLFLLSVIALVIIAVVAYFMNAWMILWIALIIAAAIQLVLFIASRLDPKREIVSQAMKAFMEIKQRRAHEFPQVVLHLESRLNVPTGEVIKGCVFGAGVK